MKYILFSLLALNFINTFQCGRILVFLPLPAWSHQNQYQRVWTALAEKGHDVTIYTKFPPKSNLTNLKHVPIYLPKTEIKMSEFNPVFMKTSPTEIFGNLLLEDFGIKALEETFGTKEFKNLMASNDEYDLVITESFFAMESTVALGHRFKAPNVVVNSIGVASNSLDFFGGPNLPSFMPDYRTAYTDEMSLFQRFRNLYIVVVTRILEYVYYYPKHQALIDKYFGSDYPSLLTLLSNVSLTFLYSHQAIAPPAPLVPNMIPVGGIHLKKPGKLPNDLQKKADEATNGFIYMSFGSVVDPSKLEDSSKLDFLEAFKTIKLPIFWKIDITNDSIINSTTIPDNVFIQKWYPQTDLLAHPNIRLFITHGGISSIIEASSLGVPMLGVPFFGDQYRNLLQVEKKGYALTETFPSLTKEGFLSKLQTMLTEPIFKENAKKWAAITRDEITAPLDRAVYWIEYVLRHKGAPHLASSSRHMSWYQMYSVDIMVILVALTLGIAKLVLMYRRRRTEKKSTSAAKKKN